ncbi:hypothetical protein [Nonomuraea sp. NPDC050310]|uniref:hypothetical protein n=1 Tax=Nonomuraea sp. NPDC050310 TaxID=3154935 RepID=UPI003406D4C8
MRVRRVQTWTVIGVIDVPAPGRYEVLYSNATGAAIRPLLDDPDAETDITRGIEIDGQQALHACNPCACCSECACQGNGEWCPGCWSFRRWADTNEPALQRYQAACAAPEGWFVVTGSNTVHAVGCSALTGTVNSVIGVLDDGCRHRLGYEPAPPRLVRAEDVRGGRRCRLCAPEISVPTPGTGRFVAGGGRDI